MVLCGGVEEMKDEQKLREIERKYGGFANFELITLCNGKYKYIADIQSQLAITEKALELACKTLQDINFKLYNTEMNFVDFFKQQAKEILENE